MSIIETIIVLIFLPSSIVAGIIFVLRKFFEQALTRDIERFKGNLQSELEQTKLQFANELQRKYFEFQTKFSSYHQKQVEVIGELYGMLNETEWSVIELVHPMQSGVGRTITEKVHETYGKCVELSRFFSKHRIYLNEDICQIMDTIITELRKSIIKFDVSHMNVSGNPDLDMWLEAWKVMEEELPRLKKALENQFRRNLSIIPDESSNNNAN